MTEKPVIQQIMDCSTVHITFRDMQLLTEDAKCEALDAKWGPGHNYNCYDHGLSVLAYRAGFFVHCACGRGNEDREDEARAGGYSAALLHLIKIAGDAGCTFLRLDADGKKYASLPVFDW